MPKFFKRPPYFSEEHSSWVIPLTKGAIALVDEDVAQTLGRHNWHALPHRNEHWYAGRNTVPQGGCIRMHREILNAPETAEVDHRKHFPFDRRIVDNRRSNIRLCSPTSNAHNRGKMRGSNNPFKGVFQVKKKWMANIMLSGKHIYLGCHATPEMAARAYDAAAREMHGEFALTNEMLGLVSRKE